MKNRRNTLFFPDCFGPSPSGSGDSLVQSGFFLLLLWIYPHSLLHQRSKQDIPPEWLYSCCQIIWLCVTEGSSLCSHY